ncbi:MAG: CHAT domain-containing protein, partial [Deltaproteobacteria bacterium]|nr:CHAT domain-containing protein [Deltaproteobacteria bacterium]
ASTRLLMENFYRARYQGDTMDKAAALRVAQMNLMHNFIDQKPAQRGTVTASFGSIKARELKPWEGTGFSHPYYWAPFVIMGNWK